jgi:dTDP-4-dehydrorhamnose 3,5-epimerase
LILEGVKLIQPRKFADARGFFIETYNARVYAEVSVDCVFVQDNQFLSRTAGTIRGPLPAPARRASQIEASRTRRDFRCRGRLARDFSR